MVQIERDRRELREGLRSRRLAPTAGVPETNVIAMVLAVLIMTT
jgi:hypothetical protein